MQMHKYAATYFTVATKFREEKEGARGARRNLH